MMIRRIVERVLATQVLTSALETQINRVLWQREHDRADLEALARLLDAIAEGRVKLLSD